MATHFLKDVAIAGREKVLAVEADFDFYRIGRILRLAIDFESTVDGGLPFLELAAEYQGKERHYSFGLELLEIRELVLPEMSPSLQLPELEIADLTSRGMEGIRFEIVSQFERAFRCTCGGIAISELRPL